MRFSGVGRDRVRQTKGGGGGAGKGEEREKDGRAPTGFLGFRQEVEKCSPHNSGARMVRFFGGRAAGRIVFFGGDRQSKLPDGAFQLRGRGGGGREDGSTCITIMGGNEKRERLQKIGWSTKEK